MRKSEPRPRIEIPQCPKHLDAEAKREWRRISPLLAELGLLARIDLATLAGYCAVFSRWKLAESEIQKVGPVVRSSTGFAQVNPWVTVADKCLTQLRHYAAEFGFGPASRSRIQVSPPATGKGIMARNRQIDAVDEFEEYLARGEAIRNTKPGDN